jgi:thiol-disulfide isomerase/thioredoxin
MTAGNKVFTTILVTGLVLGIGLMIFNSNLFNEITGAEEMQTQPTVSTSDSNPEQAQTAPQGKETVTGIVIAGKASPYLEFTQEGYETALKDKKVIVLNFYADWCPICRAELPDVKAAFDALDNRDVVGFQVNYNDPDTDAPEKALAKQYGVTYQHTKVILKDSQQVLKETAQWSKEEFITEINKAAN